MKARWMMVGLALFLLSSKSWAVSSINAFFLGDSITAGFIADTSLVEEVKRRSLRPIKWRLITYHVAKWWNPDEPHHQLDKLNHPDLAWPVILAERVSDRDLEITVSNFAVSSAVTKELKSQIAAAKKDERFKKKGMKSVFIWIGHNDLLDNLENEAAIAERFQREMTDAISKLAKGEKEITIYLLPIVDLTEVYAAIDDYVWETKKRLGRRPRERRCRETWNRYFPYWRFFPRHGREQEFDDVVKPKIKNMNGALGAIEKNAAEGAFGAARVVYLEGLFKDKKMVPEHFAKDCFHPSERGQEMIADLVFDFIGDNWLAAH
jgi:lysophospholipase L1-like esterase